MELVGPKIGIVGGTGGIGSWFVKFFENQGLNVSYAGRKTPLAPADMAKKSDVVIVSVPISVTDRVIREIGPLVPEDGLLMDLTSIKKGPVETMLKFTRSEVAGVHPLFGPDEKKIKGLRIALCPGRGEKWLKWLNGILVKSGFTVICMEPEEHDRMMGLIQGVNHFSTFALALCISRSGFKVEDIIKCSTETFKRRLDRIVSIFEQPVTLFESLLMENAAATEFMVQYHEACKELIRITEVKDKEAFGRIALTLKDFFKDTPN